MAFRDGTALLGRARRAAVLPGCRGGATAWSATHAHHAQHAPSPRPRLWQEVAQAHPDSRGHVHLRSDAQVGGWVGGQRGGQQAAWPHGASSPSTQGPTGCAAGVPPAQLGRERREQAAPRRCPGGRAGAARRGPPRCSLAHAPPPALRTRRPALARGARTGWAAARRPTRRWTRASGAGCPHCVGVRGASQRPGGRITARPAPWCSTLSSRLNNQPEFPRSTRAAALPFNSQPRQLGGSGRGGGTEERERRPTLTATF